MSAEKTPLASVAIRSAQRGEADAIGRLVAESFTHLTVARWLVPDEAERHAAMGGQFAMFAGHAMEHGTVDVIDGPDGALVAAAVWFPPGAFPDMDGYQEHLAAVTGRHVERFVKLDETMHGRHPASPDHAYLALCAVAESARDRGFGSALLVTHHRRLDAAGTPAYLEASNRRSRALYLRHGYVDHGDPYGVTGPDGRDLVVAEDGFYPMWREPVAG